MLPPLIHISAVEGAFLPLTLESEDCTVEKITELLTTHVVGEKEGTAIIPARFHPCPEKCIGTGTVDCGGGKPHRLKRNVTAVTMLGLDLDGFTEAQLTALIDSLQKMGLGFWFWTTHSHTPEVPRARLMIPFTHELPIKYPWQWSKIAWPALVKHIGLVSIAETQGLDESCTDPCRLFYFPRHPEGAFHEEAFFPGNGLDWSKVVPDFETMPEVAPRVPAPVNPEMPIDLFDLRARLRRIRKTSLMPLLSNVTKGKAPVGPPEDETRPMPRYIAWRTVTSVLALVAKDEESSEGLLAVLAESWQDEVNASPHDFTPWEKVEQLLEAARANAPQYQAEREARKKAQLEMLHKDILSRARGREEAKANPPSPSAVISAVEGTPEEEGAELRKLKRNTHGNIAKTLRNVSLILTHHPSWKGVIKLNELTKRFEMHDGPFGLGVVQIQDPTASKIVEWLEEICEFSVPTSLVREVIAMIAHDNSYSPVKEYLEALPEVLNPDIEVLEMFLHRYLNVEDTPYTRAVSRCWLLAVVARGMEPGCKVDNVLILESLEGMKKSSFVKTFFGEWSSVLKENLRNKDALMQSVQAWGIELGELTSLSRSDSEYLKAFFAEQDDTFRPPYGHTLNVFKRPCVFIGSTNRDDYLSDVTGNRRFWPVRLQGEEINLEKLKKGRDYILAVALHFWRKGQQWWLTKDEEQLRADETDMRAPEDPIAAKIKTYILEMDPTQRPAEITVLWVAEKVLMISADHANATKIGRACVGPLLKFKKERRMVHKLRETYYKIPEALLQAQKIPKAFTGQLPFPKRAEA